jgi:hypothetical protein
MLSSQKVRRVLCAAVLGVCATFLSARPKPNHYRFVLPSGYVGWVQIVFAAPEAPALPIIEANHALLVRIGESGVVRTGDLWVHFRNPHDEFFYQVSDANGHDKFVPVPDDYTLDDGYGTHAGFGINGTPDNSPGYSWFFFIGPPELRDRTPGADIRKVPGFGKKREAPATYPTPGRIPPS